MMRPNKASVDNMLERSMLAMQTLGEDEVLASPLPSLNDISSMTMQQVVSGIQAAASNELAGATVAAACLFHLSNLTQRVYEPGADAGALAATVAAMRAHPDSAAVASSACEVIAYMTLGARDADADEDVKSRLADALQAGAVQAVGAAMSAHAATSADLLQRAVMALATLVGTDAQLRQQAVAAGVSAEFLDYAYAICVPAQHGGDDDDDEDDDDEGMEMEETEAGRSTAPAVSNGQGAVGGGGPTTRSWTRSLDALADAALCAVCAEVGELDFADGLQDGGLHSAGTPREWLGDLLIRTSQPLSESVLSAVDGLLAAEHTAGMAHAGPVSGRAPTPESLQNALWLPPIGGTRLCAWRGDVRELAVGAVVNAANAQGLGCFQPTHVCIDNVLHRAAGPRLRAECRALMASRPEGLQPGAPPLVTSGHQLHAAHVMHVTGPTIQPAGRAPTAEERATLARCYTGCLEAAARHQIRSIAFCCISAGLYGYPHAQAAEAAVGAVTPWLIAHGAAAGIECVIFDIFTDTDAQAYMNATAAARQAGGWGGAELAAIS